MVLFYCSGSFRFGFCYLLVWLVFGSACGFRVDVWVFSWVVDCCLIWCWFDRCAEEGLVC